MPNDAALGLAVVSGIIGVLALVFGPQECRCPRCQYHRDQDNRSRERQRELRHEISHKGWGYSDRDPDIYNCYDIRCPRNRDGGSFR